MKKIFLTLALAAICNMVSAQSLGFLNVACDAAAAGLAGAGVALDADAWAADNNVASAVLSADKMSVGAGYGMYQPSALSSSVISAAGFARLGSRFALAASFRNFGEPEYTVTTADGRSGGSFKPSEMAATLGAAFSVTQTLGVGVNVRMASSSLGADAKASAFCADVAAFYKAGALSAGLSVNNLGGKVNYGGSDYSLPAVVKAGAAYRISGLVASLEADYLLSGAFMAAAGAEYWIADMVALRAGYHYGPADAGIPSYASVGLGAKFAGIRLNAAYLLASESLGGTLFLGVGYCF